MTVLLHFDDEQAFAERLAGTAGLACALVKRHRFPDGEVKLTLPVPLGDAAVVLRSLHHPNEKLVELLLVAGAARDLGVRDLTLVAPYLAYMRQDLAFTEGEAVSQKIVGRLLAQHFDAVVTVDPHLHRTSELSHAVPAHRAVALSAAQPIGALLGTRYGRPLLLGPDAESEQWVKAAAGNQFDYGVCSKDRQGDDDVRIALPSLPLAGRHVVIMDDVASTGGTLIECARLALQAGATRVDAAVTHALLDDRSLERLKAAGIRDLISADTVAHPSNCVSVAGLIAGAIAR